MRARVLTSEKDVKKAARQEYEEVREEIFKECADDIMALLVDSLDVIQILEDECRTQYSEGKADGMETMATILTGQAERGE